MTLARTAAPGAVPIPDAKTLIDRYCRERLAKRLEPHTVDEYRALLLETLALVGEAGLLTADTPLARAAFRATGRVQDRRKAQRIGAILEEFREWVAGH